MNIKETCKMTYLNKDNIYFYEYLGLIHPSFEQQLRNYTPEEVLILKKVHLLRKLGFTIDEIEKEILNSKTTLNMAITKQINMVEEGGRYQELKKVCLRIKEEKSTIDNIDLDKHLRYVYSLQKGRYSFWNLNEDYMEEIMTYNKMFKKVLIVCGIIFIVISLILFGVGGIAGFLKVFPLTIGGIIIMLLISMIARVHFQKTARKRLDKIRHESIK